MHCYGFVMLYLKDGPLRKEFRMHCRMHYAFVMLYLKDGPLRRSSECIAMLL